MSDNFKLYLEKLVLLQRLIAEDKDDSAEGENLRDEMADMWYSLTEDEMKKAFEITMENHSGKQNANRKT